MAEANPNIIPSSSQPKQATTTESLSRFCTRKYLTLENFIMIWLDANINIMSDDYNSFIIKFQKLVHLILPFNNADRCLDFISDVKNEKIFLIVSDVYSRNVLPILHNFHQVDSVYIFCNTKSEHENWAKQEKKVKGVFQNIQPIYDAIRRDVRQCEDDLLPFSILSSTYNTHEHLNQSDQVFMYSQLLKEILIHTDHNPNTMRKFIVFCLEQYRTNLNQSKIIHEFKHNYQQSSSIQWYTRECFIYSMLNKAFRIQDIDIIMKMSFLIQDVHFGIIKLHSKLTIQNLLTVYRGQGISETDFHTILESNNGFLSFNNFIKTTKDKDSSITYARHARDYHELIGVLFQMEIDPSIALFTPLDKISYNLDFKGEFLLSIDTIFRIHSIEQIENGLWQIQVRLTTNELNQISILKDSVRQEFEHKTPTQRLDVLAHKLQILHGAETESTRMETE